MKRDDYLRDLELNLKDIDDYNRKKIIKKYSKYIDKLISEGYEEEKIVKDIGTTKDISKKILAEYDNNKKDNNFINNMTNIILEKIKQFTKFISDKSIEESSKIIIRLIIVIIYIFLLRIPFLFIEAIGNHFFKTSGGNMSVCLENMWGNTTTIAYIITSIVILFLFVKKLINEENRVLELPSVSLNVKIDKAHSVKTKFLNPLFEVLKVLLIIMSFPLIISLLLLGIILLSLILLLFKQILFIGLFLIIISLIIINITVLLMLYNFISLEGK